MKKNEPGKPGPNNSRLPSNAANEPTPIYFTDDSNLQTPEEYEKNKKKRHRGKKTRPGSENKPEGEDRRDEEK